MRSSSRTWGQLQCDAHVFPFDGDECASGDALGLSGWKRPIFIDNDLRFLIVRSQHLRGGENVGVGHVHQQLHEGADVDGIQHGRGAACGAAADGLRDGREIFRRPVESNEALKEPRFPRAEHLCRISSDLSQPVDLHFEDDRFYEYLFALGVQVPNDRLQPAVADFVALMTMEFVGLSAKTWTGASNSVKGLIGGLAPGAIWATVCERATRLVKTAARSVALAFLSL